MELILSYRKKDFKIEWYSGSGAGGQHRNKHQNCCRITHVESGMVERGTSSRSRVDNQKEAFNKLADRVVKWALAKMETIKYTNTDVIRNYNEPRNEVHDKASGFKQSYSRVVSDGNIEDMVESRGRYMSIDSIS